MNTATTAAINTTAGLFLQTDNISAFPDLLISQVTQDLLRNSIFKIHIITILSLYDLKGAFLRFKCEKKAEVLADQVDG